MDASFLTKKRASDQLVSGPISPSLPTIAFSLALAAGLMGLYSILVPYVRFTKEKWAALLLVGVSFMLAHRA